MPITGKEMVKLALANGWIEVRKRGSHHHFKKEGVSYLVTIPVHGNEDLGKGLERKNIKRFGIIVDLEIVEVYYAKILSCYFS